MKSLLIILTISFYSISMFAQADKAFFVVHCDPNESFNFPELEKLVDSANIYDIKLTIEFTSFWVDSILLYTPRMNKLIIWQDQGHEIAMHHHGIGVFVNIWDYYTNSSMVEIHNAGRDTTDFIGDMDSLYNNIQQVTTIPIKTVGTEDLSEMPTQSVYQTSGQTIESAFSNAEATTYNGHYYCSTTHAFLYKEWNTEQMIENNYSESTEFKIMGAICHVYNFADNSTPVINYFKFINEQGIESLTVSEILEAECECGSAELQDIFTDFSIYPNPINNILIIETDQEKNCKFDVEIHNITGQIIYQQTVSSNYCEVPTTNLDSGIYILRIIQDDKEITTKKIIKQ